MVCFGIVNNSTKDKVIFQNEAASDLTRLVIGLALTTLSACAAYHLFKKGHGICVSGQCSPFKQYEGAFYLYMAAATLAAGAINALHTCKKIAFDEDKYTWKQLASQVIFTVTAPFAAFPVSGAYWSTHMGLLKETGESQKKDTVV